MNNCASITSAIVFTLLLAIAFNTTLATVATNNPEARASDTSNFPDPSRLPDFLSAKSLTLDEISEFALLLNSPGYFVFPEGGLTQNEIGNGVLVVIGAGVLRDGTPLNVGDVVDRNTEIGSGLLLCIGKDAANVLVDAWNHSFEVYLGEIVALGNFISDHPPVPAKSGGAQDSGCNCSVSCGSGYYACCNCSNPRPCRCVPNTDIETCTAGGLGATSCSINEQG